MINLKPHLGSHQKSHRKRCLLLQLFKFFLHRKPKNSVEFKVPRKMMHGFFKMFFFGLLGEKWSPKYLSFPSVMSNTTWCCDHTNGGQKFWGWKGGASSLIISLCRIIQVAAWSSCRPRKRPVHAQMLSRVINKWQHNLEYTSFYSRKSSCSTDKLNDIPNIPYNELKWSLSR